MGFNGFQRVSKGSKGVTGLSIVFIEFDVKLEFTGFLPSFTGFNLVLLGFTGF